VPLRRLVYRLPVLALALVVALYGGVCAYFWIGQERFLFSPQILPQDYTFRFPWSHEEVRLPVGGGIDLDALLFRAKPSKGVVFFLHGRGGNLQNNCQGAGLYLEQGYDFFSFDYRGFGKSGGSITAESEFHDDVSRAYEWVLARYPEEAIVVVGSSLGAAPAAKIACAHHPRHLVLAAPYTSMLDVARDWYPVTRLLPDLLMRYPFRTDLYIGSCTVPVTIVHGTADDQFPIRYAEKLSRLLPPGRCRLVRVPGADHNVRQTAVYQAEVREILAGTR